LAQPLDEIGPEFFNRPVEDVAIDLIGRRLRVTAPGGLTQSALIVETEAYGDAGDPASHAAFRAGGRAAAMFGPPGTIYVYAAYGMYPCFNVVTGPAGTAGAVLFRGVWRLDEASATWGPGRTTRALGITIADHGDTIPGTRFGLGREKRALDIQRTARIGITRGVDMLWRFVACKLETPVRAETHS
jgi:DNA-3-methyladenine glycosylase